MLWTFIYQRFRGKKIYGNKNYRDFRRKNIKRVRKCNTNLIITLDKSIRKQTTNAVKEGILRKQNNFAILLISKSLFLLYFLN